MKKIIRIFYFVCLIIFSQNVLYAQNNNESFESVVKRAISSGVMKREGTKLIYMAAPGQDTAKIRSYYEGLIKSSGKAFTFQFENKNSSSQSNNSENTRPNLVAQNPVTQINTNVRQTVIDQRSVCYARQTVFGVLHYTDRIENYSWIVPDGVTQVWIEAWSGGGNGYSKFELNPSDSIKILAITGGGGGGGAYASVMLAVEKGEKFLITIPPGGGGKSIEILLNDKKNALYLNNGGDGNADDALKGKGYGGVSGGNYGRFTNNNVFWIAGQNGGIATNVYYHENVTKGMFGQPDFVAIDESVENFGNGGGASYMNNGGRGAQFHYGSFANYASGQNGGFPGGGGGGGEIKQGYGGWFGPGKGAPGLVVIHY